MKLKFGHFFTKIFNFFEKIGGFFLRSNVLRVVVILALIATAWQFGVMSINSVTSRADSISCEGVGQADCPAGYTCADGKNGNGTCEKDGIPGNFGHTCDGDFDCERTERCDKGSNPWRCVAKECGSNPDCGQGNSCVNGKCVKGDAAGGKVHCSADQSGGTVRNDTTLPVTCQLDYFACDISRASESACRANPGCGGPFASKKITLQPGQEYSTSGPVGNCSAWQVDVKASCGGGGSCEAAKAGCDWSASCNATPPPPPPPPPTHNICKNQACVVVPITEIGPLCTIPGSNECKVIQHKECVNNACTLVNGAGADNCPNNCQPQIQSAVCDQLNASPTFGNIPLTVNFNLSGHTNGGGSIQKYKIDFGDTTTTGDQAGNTASHTYNSTGTFTARGYVTDDKGNVMGGSNSCLATISTTNRPTYKHKFCENNACVERDCPDKFTSCGSSCGRNQDCQPGNQYSVCDSLSVSPTSSNTVPLTVSANLAGHTVNGGSINQYRFNFGDGTGDKNQSGNSLSHTYNAKGTYYINGYVIDDRGNVSGGCQAAVNIYQPQILGSKTPPVMPKTGPETDAAIALGSLAAAGWLLRRAKFSWKLPKFW